MLEIVRNIFAFCSTFIIISTGVMMVLHACIAIVNRKAQLSKWQERFVFCCGISIAIIMIPIYYFPC